MTGVDIASYGWKFFADPLCTVAFDKFSNIHEDVDGVSSLYLACRTGDVENGKGVSYNLDFSPGIVIFDIAEKVENIVNATMFNGNVVGEISIEEIIIFKGEDISSKISELHNYNGAYIKSDGFYNNIENAKNNGVYAYYRIEDYNMYAMDMIEKNSRLYINEEYSSVTGNFFGCKKIRIDGDGISIDNIVVGSNFGVSIRVGNIDFSTFTLFEIENSIKVEVISNNGHVRIETTSLLDNNIGADSTYSEDIDDSSVRDIGFSVSHGEINVFINGQSISSIYINSIKGITSICRSIDVINEAGIFNHLSNGSFNFSESSLERRCLISNGLAISGSYSARAAGRGGYGLSITGDTTTYSGSSYRCGYRTTCYISIVQKLESDKTYQCKFKMNRKEKISGRTFIPFIYIPKKNSIITEKILKDI